MLEEGNGEMMGRWRGAPTRALATLPHVDLAQGTFAAAAAWRQPSLPFQHARVVPQPCPRPRPVPAAPSRGWSRRWCTSG